MCMKLLQGRSLANISHNLDRKDSMYTEKDLVAIAKRENNKKRGYLVVNRLQGKHLAVSPKEAFQMYGELADRLKREYREETLLLIGFAETATAIGSYAAIQLDSYYMQTTREPVSGVDFLHFTESHSHATEQKLVKDDLDMVIEKIDRVIFVEDEVTTGNTIWKIINIMEETYNRKICFSVASLLNGMNAEAEKKYRERNIRLHYLVKTNHDNYGEIAERYEDNGEYQPCNVKKACKVPMLTVSGCINARRLCTGKKYLDACEKLWQGIKEALEIPTEGKVLVVGTEEFMYPALFIAEKVEQAGNAVKCHSTTRSPIMTCSDKIYPVHCRYELASMYDKNRVTFLYDIDKYDNVIIVTDAEVTEEGKHSLVNAISSCGNEKIMMVRWC